jgi:hypothetical protein
MNDEAARQGRSDNAHLSRSEISTGQGREPSVERSSSAAVKSLRLLGSPGSMTS